MNKSRAARLMTLVVLVARRGEKPGKVTVARTVQLPGEPERAWRAGKPPASEVCVCVCVRARTCVRSVERLSVFQWWCVHMGRGIERKGIGCDCGETPARQHAHAARADTTPTFVHGAEVRAGHNAIRRARVSGVVQHATITEIHEDRDVGDGRDAHGRLWPCVAGNAYELSIQPTIIACNKIVRTT